MRRFTAKDLHGYLNECDTPPLLLDVREVFEYEKCHLAESKLIPMREIPAAIDQLDSQQETVVICHHGIRSRQVAYYLEQQGFEKVINLEGGVEAWAQDVDPNMVRY